MVGQGLGVLPSISGLEPLNYEVDPNSIATSMDDQLSTYPDDRDRQRRPGLSVLMHVHDCTSVFTYSGIQSVA